MMKKTFFLITGLIFSFNSFSQVPSTALTFDTNLDLIGPTTTQSTKVAQAEALIKKVVSTEAFRNAVLNHTYGGIKTFVNNDGLTNLQIYNKILEGAEELNKVKNNRMDMGVEFYYAATNTVGYTYSNITKIYVNTKYFNTNPPAYVSGNLMHEWLHKLGFTHASSYSTSRDYSVPYAIGDIISSLASKTNLDDTDTTPTLTAPSNVSLSTSGTTLTVEWGAASGATGYKVYRKLVNSTSIYLQGTVTGLSFTQTTPTVGAIYYVRSVNSSGDTVKSSEVTYNKPSTSVFTAVKNLSLTKTTSSVILKWSAGTVPGGFKEYKIYRRLSGQTTNYVQGITTSLSFTQTRPISNAVYYIRTVDMNGNTIKSSEINFTK